MPLEVSKGPENFTTARTGPFSSKATLVGSGRPHRQTAPSPVVISNVMGVSVGPRRITRSTPGVVPKVIACWGDRNVQPDPVCLKSAKTLEAAGTIPPD